MYNEKCTLLSTFLIGFIEEFKERRGKIRKDCSLELKLKKLTKFDYKNKSKEADRSGVPDNVLVDINKESENGRSHIKVY